MNSCSYYDLDENGVIVEVGGDWRTFAEENGATGSIATEIIGTSLMAHVSGHFTRRFLKEFLTRAQEGRTLSRVLYRCDAPHEKRLMEMRVRRGKQGRLHVEHETLEVSALNPPLSPKQSRRAVASHARCSMCNRLRSSHQKDWREPDDPAFGGGDLKVVHTVCQDCRAGIEIKRLRLEAR